MLGKVSFASVPQQSTAVDVLDMAVTCRYVVNGGPRRGREQVLALEVGLGTGDEVDGERTGEGNQSSVEPSIDSRVKGRRIRSAERAPRSGGPGSSGA